MSTTSVTTAAPWQTGNEDKINQTVGGMLGNATDPTTGKINSGAFNIYSPQDRQGLLTQAQQKLNATNEQASIGAQMSQNARGGSGSPSLSAIAGQQMDDANRGALAGLNLDITNQGITQGMDLFKTLLGASQQGAQTALGAAQSGLQQSPVNHTLDQASTAANAAAFVPYDQNGNALQKNADGKWINADGSVLTIPQAQAMQWRNPGEAPTWTTAQERESAAQTQFDYFQNMSQADLQKYLQTEQGRQQMQQLASNQAFQQAQYNQSVQDQARATNSAQAFQIYSQAKTQVAAAVNDPQWVIASGADHANETRKAERAILGQEIQSLLKDYDIYNQTLVNEGLPRQDDPELINLQTVFNGLPHFE